MRINGSLEVLGQLIGLKLEVLAADPVSLTAPRLWALSNEVDDSVELRFYNGEETISLGAGAEALTAFTQNVDAAGFLLKNLGAPVDGTDAARKIDIENALAGLDYQADVLAILNDGDTPVAGRYIVGTAIVAGADTNDIVSFDGNTFTLAYDVSAAGPGALVWDREQALWLRWDGNDWAQFEGLAAVTAGAGLEKTGNEMSVKVGNGIQIDGTGAVEVDTTVIATAQSVSNLSGTVTTLSEAITALQQSYFDFDSAEAGTIHAVQHNLNNKYPQVQVVDLADDTVIGVQEVKFVDANNLTVTLAEAASVRVVVQGFKVVV